MSHTPRNPKETNKISFQILSQPDDTTCGPTCLHAIYRFFGDEISIDQTINDVHRLDEGGTFASFMGIHALKRGYRSTIYTYNLKVFDPTWFGPDIDLVSKLNLQLKKKPKISDRHKKASGAYIEFLKLGGKILLEDPSPQLLERLLGNGIPIIVGLSATYLYRSMREIGSTSEPDDIRGKPAGHFVILTGYTGSSVFVADPYDKNPISEKNYYKVSVDRLIASILLGIVTYDANLLIIEPKDD